MSDLGAPSWPHDSVFDGGERGCGDLLFDLRLHFRSLPAGARVLIVALDEGAPVEIPAWCRVTGHRLTEAQHPYYLAEVKGA